MGAETKHTGMPLKVLVNFSRVVLGLTFLFSGIVKAVDPVGTQIKLTDYLYAFGMGDAFIGSTLLILACILAGFEILIGAYLAVGAFSRGTSLITLIMMCVLTPFTLYLAIKNPVQDCGCFGDAVILSNWQTFGKNVFLLALSVLVFVARKHIVPFMAERRHWWVTLIIVAVSVRFMVVNIISLPVLDFRPYKVGTDLRAAVQDHDMRFADFSIMDANLDDMTFDLLADTGYTFLLVSPHVEDASESDLDLIDDVFDYCAHWGYNMIGVTASGTEAVRQWTENAGAELQFMFSDEIPLQTMVRSNPGLMLIRDGVIVNKWSHADIPSDEVLSGPLDQISVGQSPEPDPMKTPWAVALMFGLPLLLLVAIDRLKELL
ncbi:MAG: DoxX family protein [Bacteroidaceae bacterium]|nr:DoxX family protein [Bacteroidaceae bacterium]